LFISYSVKLLKFQQNRYFALHVTVQIPNYFGEFSNNFKDNIQEHFKLRSI